MAKPIDDAALRAASPSFKDKLFKPLIAKLSEARVYRGCCACVVMCIDGVEHVVEGRCGSHAKPVDS